MRKDGEEKASKVSSSSSSPQRTPCVAQRARASYGADKPRVRRCMRQPVVVFTADAHKSRVPTRDLPSPTASVGNPAPPADPSPVMQPILVAIGSLPRERERRDRRLTRSAERFPPKSGLSRHVQALPRAAGDFMVAVLLPLAPGA